MKAFKIAVLESERGWGSKIDDWMVCETREDCYRFREEFNSENTSETVPDWYMLCLDRIEPIDLTESQTKAFSDRGRKRMWESELKKL